MSVKQFRLERRARRLKKPIMLTTRLGVVLCWTWAEWGREVLAARGV